MTVRELIDVLNTLPDDTEVVYTATKFHSQATEQFVDRVGLTKLADGRQVLAIDQYRHADNYDLEE